VTEPRQLYSDPWVTVTIDEATDVVRYVRSERPYASLAEIEQCHAALFAHASWPQSMKLLLDLRRAPPRNDEKFEALARSYVARLRSRTRAVVWLVRTAVGKLQMARMGADGGQRFEAFDDEEEALRYLASF
jgi:hypothetical protein